MTEEFINFITPYLVSIFGSYAVPILSVIGIVILIYQVIKQVKGLCESVKHNDGYDKIEKQLIEKMHAYQEEHRGCTIEDVRRILKKDFISMIEKKRLYKYSPPFRLPKKK